MSYVDGFVLSVPEEKLGEYKKLAKIASKVWLEHGALEYRECVGDDLNIEGVFSFNDLVKPKKGEVVIFAFIVYKSKADRKKINAKVMKDPRMVCDPNNLPFDCKRMAYGGFKAIVEAESKA